MAKRNKHAARRTHKTDRQERLGAPSEAAGQRAALVADPPARRPSLLGFSILLFVLWFVFLFVTALLG